MMNVTIAQQTFAVTQAPKGLKNWDEETTKLKFDRALNNLVTNRDPIEQQALKALERASYHGKTAQAYQLSQELSEQALRVWNTFLSQVPESLRSAFTKTRPANPEIIRHPKIKDAYLEIRNLELLRPARLQELYKQAMRADAVQAYTVTLRDVDTGAEGAFEFSQSINDTRAGKVVLTESDLIGAVGCFLEDALNPIQYDLGDFLSDFGYTEGGSSVKKGIQVYEACKESCETLKRLLPDGTDLYDAVNDYRELYEDHL